jgi:hypothetical protein
MTVTRYLGGFGCELLPALSERHRNFLKVPRELRGSIVTNGVCMPNNGDPYRHRKMVSVSAESTTNQVMSKTDAQTAADAVTQGAPPATSADTGVEG